MKSHTQHAGSHFHPGHCHELSASSTSYSVETDKASLPQNNMKQQDQHTGIIWPAIAVCVPMVLICGTLLVVIFANEVKPTISLFQTYPTSDFTANTSSIFVDFSATQLAFLASFTSTMGPLLTGSLMSLASVTLFQCLKQPSDQKALTVLPTPYQVSLLIGMIAASYEQLWKSMRYLVSRKRKTKAPRVLWYAAATLVLSVTMGIALTVADAVFHSLTTTISFTRYSDVATAPLAYGRGLNAFCGDFDRLTDNYGFPCTIPMASNFTDPDYYNEQAEIQYLAHNTSAEMEIRHAAVEELQGADIAYLIPNPLAVDSQIDYRATTLGVSAQCKLIPPSSCNISRWGDRYPVYTNFNCSSNFYGVLGLPPNATNIISSRQPSQYISFLSIKPQSNLQYNFFTDDDLENVYNPAGFNDSGVPDPNLTPLSDSQLMNTIHLAFAWRTASGSFIKGSKNEMLYSNQTGHYNATGYIDYFLDCELQAYNVNYTWFNQSLSSISASLVENGTVLNMWQGTNAYGPTVNGGGHVFQDINIQAAVAGTSTRSYETTFGNLLSQQILATIGGYTSTRPVLAQQSRETLLVARVPKAALGVLLMCSLIYPVLGLVFLYKVYQTSHDHGRLAPLFSYWGLASTAWNENEHHRRSALITADAVETCEREEKLRLYVDRSSIGDFRFALWMHQQQDLGGGIGDRGTVSRPEDIGIAV